MIFYFPLDSKTLESRWDTTGYSATVFSTLSRFSAALVVLAKSISLQSLHLFFCQPLLLVPFTVPVESSAYVQSLLNLPCLLIN